MNWLQLAITLEPALFTVAKDLAALFKKHPRLTPEQILSVVSEIRNTNAETLAIIEADQAAHK